ncbi:zinc finger protein 709 isoform X2 [Folsomia candida]|uniref:Zinc finger protein 26 n=1 Tax=Folsomia candida TaxID=158441 RepID=A0A226EDR2_FOLCA|nr:zinc finger protein 709 isoform X2 [Folsomia candida]OXA54816.1 Zinc finger protein 26 [Folsomia candida]
MDSTCFFCHLTYYSTLTKEARKTINKLFLTYLEVINLSTVEIQDAVNLGKVPFHACPPCVTTLQNISTHILQLEEEIKKICTIISQHCGDGEVVGRLAELRKQIISRSRPNVQLNLENVIAPVDPEPLKLENYPEIKLENDVEIKLENDVEVKLETDPGEESDVDLDDFMIHPDNDNDDMDTFEDPLSVPAVTPPSPPYKRVGRPPKKNSYPPGWKKPFRGVEVTRVDHKQSLSFQCGECDFNHRFWKHMRCHILEKHQPVAAEAWGQRSRVIQCPHHLPMFIKIRPFQLMSAFVPTASATTGPSPLVTGYIPFLTWGASGWVLLYEPSRIIDCKNVLEAFNFKCSHPSCGVLFATQELLSSHITLKHTIHSCGNCDFTCNLPSHLLRHISEAHPELPDPLKCPTCVKVLSSQLQFDAHVTRCKDETKPQRPTSVQTSSTTWTYLDVAMSKVGDKVLCSLCDYTNPKKFQVMQHIRAVHKKHLPFRCPSFACSWPFANQSQLDEHLASTGHGPQVCDVCGKVAKSKDSLQQHVKTAHKKQDRFICTTCGKGFPYLSGCKVHESTCTPANHKPKKLNAEEKAILAAGRKSILEQEIISNSCKHCAKRIFGSYESLSFHEEKCRVGSRTDVQEGEEVIRRGVRLIDDSVELSLVKVKEPHDINLHKCWGCNQTFHHKPPALAHIRAARHGDNYITATL